MIISPPLVKGNCSQSISIIYNTDVIPEMKYYGVFEKYQIGHKFFFNGAYSFRKGKMLR